MIEYILPAQRGLRYGMKGNGGMAPGGCTGLQTGIKRTLIAVSVRANPCGFWVSVSTVCSATGEK